MRTMKLVSSGKSINQVIEQNLLRTLGFVKENSHFERRAVADSFTSQILSAVRLADLFFWTKMEKLFRTPARSSFLAPAGTFDQLMVQVKNAIKIFEALHPGCQAVFIFDQSSAHASLPPDALRAFEMNKSDGGKQRKQRDTVIPMTNPGPCFRGKLQKMTTVSGEAKGLKTVLEERGFNIKGLRAKCAPVCPFESQKCCLARLLSQQDDFTNQQSMLETLIKESGHECLFLPKFHCELNPIEMVSHCKPFSYFFSLLQYWGWCKYRYREHTKENFKAAKDRAIQVLDACPTDVIRRFINRSWRFIAAYERGLSGKAAAWAVKQQKTHRSTSEAAMTAIESVLD
jgi:hypothetical protein